MRKDQLRKMLSLHKELGRALIMAATGESARIVTLQRLALEFDTLSRLLTMEDDK